MDNWSNQNKNSYLCLSILSIVNHSAGPSMVTLKYLERGHTYMRADSIHCLIQTALQGQVCGNLWWCACFEQKLWAEYLRQKMEMCDFRDWANLRGQAKELPRISRMWLVEFRKRSHQIFYKLNLDFSHYQITRLTATISLSLPAPSIMQRYQCAEEKGDLW